MTRVSEWVSEWVYIHYSLQFIEYIGQLCRLWVSLAMTTTYSTVHCTTQSSFLCQRAEGRAHRKEGNHAKLNNAVAQSPDYDLVNGWLYKHSDPPGQLRLTAQSSGWIDQFLWTNWFQSLESIHSIQHFNSPQLLTDTWARCIKCLFWHCENIPPSELS